MLRRRQGLGGVTAIARFVTSLTSFSSVCGHRFRVMTALKGSWQHGGPIPARYRGLLQELRQEVAAKPGLERRAKKVHHELDTVALGR